MTGITGSNWYAARTGRGQELKMRERLHDKGIEYYIPTRESVRERNGRKVKVQSALIPNLVFLKASKADALSLVNALGFRLKYLIDPVKHSLLVVPDKQMEDFMRVVDEVPDSICDSDFTFVPGGRVCVKKGQFSGIEGEVVYLPNRTYVVVSLGRLMCAKVQIPKCYLEPVDR